MTTKAFDRTTFNTGKDVEAETEANDILWLEQNKQIKKFWKLQEVKINSILKYIFILHYDFKWSVKFNQILSTINKSIFCDSINS